ncbi:hypothetical protein MRS44_005358 [Fusarium solani]|uniref:uncharacterized protein n=1 Tax=Fusarium solani TaxID=169388 RepID=UPI0032C423A4|nr:hypothetical protein MRS44_005358 [Fusarium solani]
MAPFPAFGVSSVISGQDPGDVDLASLEGESSFRRQALLAVNITEVVSLAGGGSPKVVDKLSDLRKLLEDKPSPEPSHTQDKKDTGEVAFLQCEMPPADFVVRLLRAPKGSDLNHEAPECPG